MKKLLFLAGVITLGYVLAKRKFADKPEEWHSVADPVKDFLKEERGD